MTSTSGTAAPAFSRSAARCSTPKRCCSSTTTAPRLWNATPSWIRAWVPITRSTDPSASPASTRRRSAPVTRLVSSSTLSGRSPKRFPAGTSKPSSSRWTLVTCCSARTSVGAISAPWWPPCTAASNAVTATTVLPEPTSPWSSRCIGCGAARSASISAITRRWAAVSGKLKAAWNRRTSSPPVSWRIPTASRSIARLRMTSASCTRSSSSNASRRRARCLSSIDSGRWMSCNAAPRSISPNRRRTGPGTGSAKPRGAHRSRAFSTHPASSHVAIWAFSLCG